MQSSTVSRSKLVFTRVALALTAAASLAIAGPPLGQNPPEVVDDTFVLDPSASTCSFPVRISLTGKGKLISLPGNRQIITAPGQYATLTNLDAPSRQVTLNTTGVFTLTTQPDGGLVGVGTGRNLATDPVYGLTLVIGRFSFAFDKDGNLIQPLTLHGGQAISACGLIE